MAYIINGKTGYFSIIIFNRITIQISYFIKMPC